MKKFRCTSSIIVCCDSEDCDYIYDPALGDRDHGIEPGTEFCDLPENWICPNCGAGKEAFKEIK